MVASRTNIEQVVHGLRNLGEPTRLRLVTLLGHGELTVGEICLVLGQSQPRVSRHLRLLAEAGFLDRFREQQRVYYRTPASGPRAAWLNELLAAVDPDDPALQHDRMRLAAVVGERQKSASSALGSDALSNLDQDGLVRVLREELGSSGLGELLDIGTGTGWILEVFGAQAIHAVGVDLSAPALRLARARLHGHTLAHCEFRRGDMYALPFAAESFDTVTIDRVLAMAARPVAVLAEAARVMRPSGRLLVIDTVDQIRACTGVSPLLGMRGWLQGSGFNLTRLQPCDLASGQYLLASAQRS